jgi:hypothetical protein
MAHFRITFDAGSVEPFERRRPNGEVSDGLL